MEIAAILNACQKYADQGCDNYPAESGQKCSNRRENPDSWCGRCLMTALMLFEGEPQIAPNEPTPKAKKARH